MGGVVVPVAAESADEKLEQSVDKQRMQDGSLRAVFTTSSPNKRILSFTTRHMLDSDAATLRAQLVSTSLPLTCSGDLLGGSVSMIPELTSYKPVRRRGALYRIVSATLTEA